MAMVQKGTSQYKLKLYRHLIHEQPLFFIWVALPLMTSDDVLVWFMTVLFTGLGKEGKVTARNKLQHTLHRSPKTGY
jgi:hypothetical protein